MGSEVNGNGLQVPWKACDQPGCGWEAANDSNETRDYIQTVVNRYKSNRHYWEIANEMDGNTRRPSGLPPEDFADFLNYNYKWIKLADPDARVLLPGLLGTYGLPSQNARDWLSKVLDAGGGSGFDIVNYHDYNSWWTLAAHFDSLKALLHAYNFDDKPIWVTECSISSDNSTSITPAYASENEQAADVWRRSAILFGKGVQTWFWHSFWSSGGNSEWREFGILNSKGERKKAWYAYRLLLEKVEGFDSAQLLSEGVSSEDNSQGGNGTWVTRYDFSDGNARWVMWNPDGGTYNLSVPDGYQVFITEVVPATIASDRMSATFNTDTRLPQNGVAAIDLTGDPVLVELQAISALQIDPNSPQTFELYANYPNPFNPKTRIPYRLTHSGQVELAIYNIQGKKITTLVKDFQVAGLYQVTWNGTNDSGLPMPSGVYQYVLRTEHRSQSRSMLLLK